MVGDATFVAVAIAYLIVEINIIGGGGAWSSVDPNEVPWSILGFDDPSLRTMIPLVILATGLAGQRLGRLSSGPAFIGCLAVVINPVALASVYATPLPWLVIGCITFVTVEAGWRAGDELTLEQREGFTVYLLVALTATTIYVASGRFDLTIIGLGTDLTVRGFPVVGAILAGLAWFSGRAADELELGLNEIVHRWSSGTPDERPDRMELFRPSVLSAISHLVRVLLLGPSDRARIQLVDGPRPRTCHRRPRPFGSRRGAGACRLPRVRIMGLGHHDHPPLGTIDHHGRSMGVDLRRSEPPSIS